MIRTLLLVLGLGIGANALASESSPASAPAAIDPERAAQARASASTERGLSLLEKAREASAPREKHDLYTTAEASFKEARTAFEEIRHLKGSSPSIEDRLAELNRWIYECRKSRPLILD